MKMTALPNPFAITLCILETPKQVLWHSEDPDEMPQNAAFHQDLHCLLT